MAQGTSELPPVPERPRDARAHQARCSTSQKLQKNIKVSHWVKPFVPVATALFCKKHEFTSKRLHPGVQCFETIRKHGKIWYYKVSPVQSRWGMKNKQIASVKRILEGINKQNTKRMKQNSQWLYREMQGNKGSGTCLQSKPRHKEKQLRTQKWALSSTKGHERTLET